MVQTSSRKRLLVSSEVDSVMSDSRKLSLVMYISLMPAMATIVEGDDWKITHLLAKKHCDFISVQADAPLRFQGSNDLKKQMYVLF